MIKAKNIIFGIFILVILVNTVSALSITINMKSSFETGEKISLDYTIVSTTSQEIQYVVSINCPNAPAPLLDVKNKNLIANTPFTETYTYMSSLNDNTESQICKAAVSILSPEVSEEKSFEIKTSPSFEFNLLTCKDVNCNEESKVFVKNGDIYLDYASDAERVSAAGVLTYPNGNTYQLTLPISIKAEQIGTYNLEISASKQGYKTITKEIQFGVIEKQANISYGFKGEVKKINLVWLVIIGALVILVGVFIYLIYKRRQ